MVIICASGLLFCIHPGGSFLRGEELLPDHSGTKCSTQYQPSTHVCDLLVCGGKSPSCVEL